MGFLAFALLLPETSETCCCTEFPGFRRLVLGDADGLAETSFGCSMVVGRRFKEAFTLKAMDVGCVPIPITLVHKRPCQRERTQGFLNLTCRPIGLGEEGKVIRSGILCTPVLGDHESVLYLSHTLCALSV